MGKQIHLQKLDAIRGFAALYVVAHHFASDLKFLPPLFTKLVFSFGQEAVMLFFLLSGFVISWSVQKSAQLTFKSYFIKRFRRIYFPFLIAIFLSLFVAYFNGSLKEEFSTKQLLGNLLMLQDFASVKPGIWFEPFLANYPLWSLAYEWWFYLLFFPCYQLLPKNGSRIYFILAFSAIAFIIYMTFPNQAALFISYFIIWWCGVEAAEILFKQERFTVKNMMPIIFCMLFMSILALIPVLNVENIQFGYYPFLTLRHFTAALIAILIGLIWYQYKLVYFEKTLGLFTFIAPISYGIYVFHYPLLKQLPLTAYFSNPWLSYSLKFALILGLSYIVEVKLQPLVNKWLN